jgi:hypothetical protein
MGPPAEILAPPVFQREASDGTFRSLGLNSMSGDPLMEVFKLAGQAGASTVFAGT